MYTHTLHHITSDYIPWHNIAYIHTYIYIAYITYIHTLSKKVAEDLKVHLSFPTCLTHAPRHLIAGGSPANWCAQQVGGDPLRCGFNGNRTRKMLGLWSRRAKRPAILWEYGRWYGLSWLPMQPNVMGDLTGQNWEHHGDMRRFDGFEGNYAWFNGYNVFCPARVIQQRVIIPKWQTFGLP